MNANSKVHYRCLKNVAQYLPNWNTPLYAYALASSDVTQQWPTFLLLPGSRLVEGWITEHP